MCFIDRQKKTVVFMKSEKTIQDEIRIALSDHGIVFRTNSGEFWQGKRVYSKEFDQMVLINLRKVQGLPEGFSDLLVVSDKKVSFVEVKNAKGKARDKQLNFIGRMQSLGHKAGIARSVDDALEIIGVQP